VIFPADALNHRIDFNGVHTARPPRERTADVIAGSRPDDEHVAKWRTARIPLEQVR
jgi:hypothetical protein